MDESYLSRLHYFVCPWEHFIRNSGHRQKKSGTPKTKEMKMKVGANLLGKCQRRPSSSELVFNFYFFGARKIPILFFEHTCICILCICKISQCYTFTCGLQEKDKYTFFNEAFIFVIGPEICYFCTAYESQHFSTKFNTFLRNTYKFS